MLELGRKKKDKPVWFGFTVQTSVLKQAFRMQNSSPFYESDGL